MRSSIIRYFTTAFFFAIITFAHAQKPVLTGIESRLPIKAAPDLSSIMLGLTDTLDLPFFDDFTTTNGYPDERLYTDRQVWVNNGFAKKQPNYGIATFDHLNPKGNPYSTINAGSLVFADSLTSQAINLATYKVGMNTLAYAAKDSVYMSFYYALQGLGDMPETEDSLILFFKNNAGSWIRVWSVAGGSATNFNMVMVPIIKNEYFNKNFQFRFVNFTKATGNLNHFHVDYIAINRNRTAADKNIPDIGIVNNNGSMLRNYFTMPYPHFLEDVTNQEKTQTCVTVQSLHQTQTVQTRFAFSARNTYNKLLDSVDFSQSSRNILPLDDSTECFTMPRLDTFSGARPCLKLNYYINPLAGAELPDDYNALGNNNYFSRQVCFEPWYAYDDGTAEGGIGLDYTFLPPNQRTQLAVKFESTKTDTLRGISVYFNQSKEDVKFRSFYLNVWKSLSPIDGPDNADKLYYSVFISKPVYRDSINHFAYFMFDTALLIPEGTFYIGWRQDQKFILNVGYDNNYRYQDQERFNPNVFYNVQNSWKKGFDVYGVPMMRPLFGGPLSYTFSTKKQETDAIGIYPNPTSDKIQWSLSKIVNRAFVYALSGKKMLDVQATDPYFGLRELSLKDLPPGTYFLSLQLQNGQILHSKIIRQ